MKNICLIAIATLCSLTAIGQLNLDTIYPPQCESNFLLPPCFASGAFPVTPICFNELADTVYEYSTGRLIGFGAAGEPSKLNLVKTAQPYYVDSLICIRGLAMLGSIGRSDGTLINDCDSNDKSFLELHRGLGNVIDSIRIDTIADIHTGYSGWIEVFFDNPIFITDTFYVAGNFSPNHPATGSHPRHWCRLDGVVGTLLVRNLKLVTEPKPIEQLCCSEMTPYVLELFDTVWQPIMSAIDALKAAMAPYTTLYNLVAVNETCYPAFYLFPILDTTPITQCQFNSTSIDDTTNSTITLEVVTSAHGFPVPHTIGFVFDTNPNNLNLNNPNVVYYPYDTNQSLYSWTLPYSYLLCNTTYYYRSFVITQLDTIFSDINSFIKQCSSGLDGVIGNDIVAKLSPNPADKEITITTAIPMQKVEITNATGQKVYEQSLKTSSVKVNTSKFSSGNYIATVHTEKGMVKKQFVVK
ncbi:MAG: T9SS type A sorting domain-containing protein [Bacteroidales bacterium]|jgi:hypothetical protein|nr:T9SS type A sorting domain-containing protein [Bacteroidales bacterium]